MVKKFKEFFTEETPDPVKGEPGKDVITNADDATDEDDIPAIFATIHYKSDDRPDGYTAEDLADINNKLNKRQDDKDED